MLDPPQGVCCTARMIVDLLSKDHPTNKHDDILVQTSCASAFASLTPPQEYFSNDQG
eukprot:m.1639380 g.1639380  ORF g.1639380 m.1639380 type:complete len:57 (+) comp34964_c0_seq1:46-216(+)